MAPRPLKLSLLILTKEHSVIQVLLRGFFVCIFNFIDILAKECSGSALVLCDFVLSKSLFLIVLVEFVFLGFDIGALILQQLELCLESECLTHHLELFILELCPVSVKVTAHLLVLDLEQVDVLVRGLVIVVKTANTALFLIFNNFLF
jgi:hypothetical protein